MKRLTWCELVVLMVSLVGFGGRAPRLAFADSTVAPVLLLTYGKRALSTQQQESIVIPRGPDATGMPSITLSPQELVRSPVRPKPHPCIRIVSFDAKAQEASDGFAKMIWTARILNICSDPLPVRLHLLIRDYTRFALAQDYTDAVLRRHATNNTSGILVMPIDTMLRMTQYELQVTPR